MSLEPQIAENNQLKDDLSIFTHAMWHGSKKFAALDVYLIKDMLDYIIENQNLAQLHADIPCPGDELYTEVAEELFCNIGTCFAWQANYHWGKNSSNELY